MPPAANLPASDLLQRIPLSAQVILDVGCGTGDLGAAFKRLGPKARVIGIEQDPEAAAVASGRLDEVAILDVDSTELPFDLPNGLDCIIYSAALAHMRDPWHIIREHAKSLNANGVMLICVPNIEHWSFAEQLLRGGWDYADAGLLDRTHLRWFSRDSVLRGLRGLGLHVSDVMPRIFQPDAAAPFLAALAPGLQALGVDAAEYARRALPLQYILRVQRIARPRLHIAATALPPVGGVTDLRVVYPLEAMATEPAVIARIASLEDFATLPDGEAGIAVLHRPVLRGAQGLVSLRRLHAQGWLTVTEFDDLPDFFPAMRGKEQYSFTGVHAVQTTTEALATVLRARNPEVAVFPNAVRALPVPGNFTDPKTLTLFFGALNREGDWRDLLGVVNDVIRLAGDRLRFQVVHDRGFYAGLATPRKNFTPLCDHATYLALLGASEISFMPLADTAFNRAKSDLKFIEAAACRVVPLASAVVYAGAIEDGKTGLIFRDAQELRARLLRLISFPAMAREIAEAARAQVIRERMLADQVATRLSWYRDLWARRDTLRAALDARVPELKD